MRATQFVQSTGRPFTVVFGFEEKNGTFRVSHSKPSRGFRTLRGAERAIAAYLAGN